MEKLCEGGMGEHIGAFTCVCDEVNGEGLFWAISTVFPNLTFLGLVFPEELVPHLYPDSTYFKFIVSGILMIIYNMTHLF